MIRIVPLFALVLTLPLAAAEKVNKPALVNADACECKVDGPDEICRAGETVEITIFLVNGKPKIKQQKVEIKGTSDAEWGEKGGGTSFDINLPCDGTKPAKVQLWTGTKNDTVIEIWVGKAKCKTIKVLRCPSETITAQGAVCGPGEYGATFVYSYGCAKDWWFRETVTKPAGAKPCGDTRQLHQREAPQQMAAGGNSIIDEILNEGDPAAHSAGCQESNEQTVFIGRTADECLKDPCTYQHTHTIAITPAPGGGGTVTTTVNAVSTSCTFPAP